jgi:formamidopyrimidine-DNA glycosylase
MPELPEVETTLRGTKPHIEHKMIEQVIVREHQLRFKIPTQLSKKLSGKKIKKVIRRGKYLLFLIDQGALILHLGMSGSLRVLKNNVPPKKHDHVDIVFADQTRLRFTDPRKFGTLLWVANGPLLHPLLAKLGPEPLTKDFSAKYLFAMGKNRAICIKSFIMDSKIVVGIGNIYATEALFLARIGPSQMTKTVSIERLDTLVKAIKKILREAIIQGGTTLKDFVNSDGKPGYFVNKLKVYGRSGKPCVVCQLPLVSVRIANRNTVYCENCQRDDHLDLK